MSQATHEHRMRVHFKRRGRTPAKATHRIAYTLVTHKSRAGVKYKNYQTTLEKI